MNAAYLAPEAAGDPDIEKNKAFAILAYVLFLIPLVAAEKEIGELLDTISPSECENYLTSSGYVCT